MRNKFNLVLFLCLIFTPQVYAQQQKADSLLQLINSSDQISNRIEKLNALANHYWSSNQDSAFKYISKAILLAEQNNLPKQLTESYNVLGTLWYNKNNKDSAFYYLRKGNQTALQNNDYLGIVKSLINTGDYKTRSRDYNDAFKALNEALKYKDKISDPLLLSMLYNSLAILYKKNGNTDLALENYHKALQISEEHDLIKRTGIILSNIGLLYETQDKTDLALKYLNRSLGIRLKQGNRIGESYVRTNLGVVYENLGEYDKALKQYKKSLTIKKEINNKNSIAILFNNIGIIYKKQALYDSAFNYCSRALNMRIELNDRLGEARTRTTIGQIYYLQGKNKNALEELHKALQLATDFKNFTVLQNIYSSLSNVYFSQKNYKTAITYLQKNYAYRDSIFNIQKEKSINDIETKYNTLKKEKENLLLSQENDQKEAKIKSQIIIGIGLLCVTVLFFLFLIIVNRSRNKLATKNKEIKQQTIKLTEANNKLEQLAKFKETMTNMLVHDLKTPLNVIVNYKDLKELDSIDDLVQHSGYSMQNLVHNILDVHKHQHTKLELNINTIAFSNVINEAFEEVSFLAKEKKLCFCIESGMDYVIEADENLLKRVFVNLFTNAIKFTPENGTITIIPKLEKAEKLRISIVNPGPGIPKEKQELIFEYFQHADNSIQNYLRPTGLGLSFCKIATEAHNGEIGVISETKTGVEFWFTLPDVQQEIPLNHNFEFDWVKYAVTEI